MVARASVKQWRPGVGDQAAFDTIFGGRAAAFDAGLVLIAFERAVGLLLLATRVAGLGAGKFRMLCPGAASLATATPGADEH